MNKKGVTLLELMIAIIIVAITATFVVPNIGRQIQRYRLKVAARDLSNYLLESRAEAIKNADFTNPVAFRIVFSQTNKTYKLQKYQSASWSDQTQRSLPTGVSISAYGGLVESVVNTRYFKSDGSTVLDLDTDPTNDEYDSSPVTLKIQLSNAKGDHYQVTLYSLTGLTEVQEGWN